jgi:hypothetical protein
MARRAKIPSGFIIGNHALIVCHVNKLFTTAAVGGCGWCVDFEFPPVKESSDLLQ